MLLSHPGVDVNRRNNDRLTSFMLAMQTGASGSVWAGWGVGSANAQEKLRRLMDVAADNDNLEDTRHDRWTALMEVCNSECE